MLLLLQQQQLQQLNYLLHLRSSPVKIVTITVIQVKDSSYSNNNLSNNKMVNNNNNSHNNDNISNNPALKMINR